MTLCQLLLSFKCKIWVKDETFSSETQLRDFISEKFDDLRGVRPRTLADKFALAKKALKGELE